MRPIVIVLKAVLAGVTIWMFMMFSIMLDVNIVQFTTLTDFISDVSSLISYGFDRFYWVLLNGLGSILGSIGGGGGASIGGSFYDSVVSQWFSIEDNFSDYYLISTGYKA